MYRRYQPGGSVKAEGLGDGPAHVNLAIAKLRLTLPPMSWTILCSPWNSHCPDGMQQPIPVY